jgi:hypothetical protein
MGFYRPDEHAQVLLTWAFTCEEFGYVERTFKNVNYSRSSAR